MPIVTVYIQSFQEWGQGAEAMQSSQYYKDMQLSFLKK